MRKHVFLPVVLTFIIATAAFAGGKQDPKGSVANVFTAALQPQAEQDSVVTLNALLNEALQASPKLQASKARAQGAESRVAQAGAWDDPQVGVEFFATPVTSLNPFRDGMETDYFVQQMIPLFGKKGLMADAAAAGSRMAEQTALSTERTLTADVKKAYAMILATQKRIDVNTENQRLLEQIVASARSRYGVGQASMGDVLKVQVELGRLQNERAELDQELASAVSMMNALRGKPADAPIGRVADVTPVQVRATLNDLNAAALEKRPELRGMNFELEMNRADLAASKRMWIPDLMVRGMYKRMVMGEDQWDAMLSINIPIAPWSSGKYSGKVEENELNVKATEQSIGDMRNMVLAEVRDAWSKTASRWQQLRRYEELMLPQAEQSLKSTLNAYQSGSADFLSLLDSYRMLQMLRMEYYMLVGQYLSDVATLERSVGEGLAL